MYPEDGLAAAEERLRLSLIQQWGGPATYSQLRGPTRLGARHMPFRIARPHRDAWLSAMRIAIDDPRLAPAHRERLRNQLETMAWNFTTPRESANDPDGVARSHRHPGRRCAPRLIVRCVGP
jgi:hemoglobin